MLSFVFRLLCLVGYFIPVALFPNAFNGSSVHLLCTGVYELDIALSLSAYERNTIYAHVSTLETCQFMLPMSFMIIII
jgi:hypothetical protein